MEVDHERRRTDLEYSFKIRVMFPILLQSLGLNLGPDLDLDLDLVPPEP